MILRSLLQVGWSPLVARFGANRIYHLLKLPPYINLAKCDYFTYTWTIENVNNFHRSSIRSPIVKLIKDEMCHDQWCVELCLQSEDRPDMMSAQLLEWRPNDHEHQEVTDKDYKLSILASDGSSLIEREIFSSDPIRTLLVPRDEVLLHRKTEFMPNNTLTLQLKMGFIKKIHCFARTRLRIEKVSLPWILEDFRTSNNSSKYSLYVRSTYLKNVEIRAQIFWSGFREEKLKMKLIPGLSYDNYDYDDDKSCGYRGYRKNNRPDYDENKNDGHVSDFEDKEKDSSVNEEESDDNSDDFDDNFYIESSDEVSDDEEFNYGAVDCYTCKISLSDAAGNQKSLLEETRFDFIEDETIDLQLTKSMLLKDPTKYLINGSLSLNCLFTFYSKASKEEIDFTKHGESDHHEYSKVYGIENKEVTPTLKDYLRSLYDDHTLCDFTIQTNTKFFPVHKSILASRSPIFRSFIMDNVNQDLYISDVDSETMHQFLLYLYTDQVEDMQWETALKLFMVADQFQIPTLMKKCSAMLAEKLTIENVCDMLLLAYKYQDEYLKSSIHDFISSQDVLIFSSDNWAEMEEKNWPIAIETLRVIRTKK